VVPLNGLQVSTHTFLNVLKSNSANIFLVWVWALHEDFFETATKNIKITVRNDFADELVGQRNCEE